MTQAHLFTLQLILGYVAWLLCHRAYIWPWLTSMPTVDAHRLIATLHSFRFFGLVFVIPGVTSASLPASFASSAAYGDLAAGMLAILALLTVRVRPLFWTFVIAFNVVGMIDLLLNYVHAVRAGLPAAAGNLGAAYAIPVLYVPLLMITHGTALVLLMRTRHREPTAVRPADATVAPH